jgi:8-oxo-dGTP pyrophosphatase MutT (NUDIX family)
LIRIFFQIEIAHWFYLDFYCDSQFLSSSSSSAAVVLNNQLNKSLTPIPNNNIFNDNNDESNDNIIQQQQTQLLKPCSIRTFAENIFRHCPFLMQHTNQVDDILSKWKVFKHAVPTNGAIVLDETMKYVLLVQGFWTKASWGFPKGKVVEEESEAKCAIREVLEETGYDISKQLNEDHYLEISINDQTIRLYIITNVSKTTKFEPRTRREIKEVRWFAIDELPVHRKDTRTKQTLGYSPNSFFMVIPFLKYVLLLIIPKNLI